MRHIKDWMGLALLAATVGCAVSSTQQPQEPVPAAASEASEGTETTTTAVQPEPEPEQDVAEEPAAQVAEPEPEPPSAGAVITHKVKDYDAWKQGFDAHEDARREAGIVGHALTRVDGKPRLVSVYLAANDVEDLQAFVEDEALKKVMKQAGVVGKPKIHVMTHLDDESSQDPEATVTVFGRAKVKDFDAWRANFEDNEQMRAEASVVGYGVSQDPENDQIVYVWLQATNLDKVKEMLGSKQFKKANKAGGVKGKPDITVGKMVEMKRYD